MFSYLNISKKLTPGIFGDTAHLPTVSIQDKTNTQTDTQTHIQPGGKGRPVFDFPGAC